MINLDLIEKNMIKKFDIMNEKVKECLKDNEVINSETLMLFKKDEYNYIYDSELKCSIELLNNYINENCRIFSIKRFDKDEKMLKRRLVGLYTKKYEKYEDIPPRMDSYEKDCVVNIMCKINNMELEKGKTLQKI